MNEEQERIEQDRWRELADLLGLPPESAPDAKASAAREKETVAAPAGRTAEYAARSSSFDRPAARPEPEHRPEPVHEPAPPQEARQEAPLEAPAWERPPVGRHEMEEAGTTEVVEPLEPEAAADERAAAEGGEQGGERPERSEESEDRSRRRRRGRRGRRGGRRDREAARDEGEPESAERAERAVSAGRETPAPSAEDDEDERLSGHRPPEDDLGEELDLEAPADEPPPPAPDDRDEPEEPFAEWNVPSWTELIDSLYRPGR